ncbi:MAG: GNAT family N-acetyltransferase [Eubacteriales bacterium]|nr:GNAT family N-acetyltransferase [Eubacteriales bacterium]
MEIRELTMDEIAQIYEAEMRYDFPESELKPLSAIRAMYEKGVYLGLGCWENGRLLAYAMYVTKKERKRLLLDYYAVVRTMRERGIGSRFLQGMFEWLKDAEMILGEVENPEFARTLQERETQVRRIGFYERNGFVVAGPECTCRLFGVEYRLIAKGLGVSSEEAAKGAARWIEEIYRVMFPGELFGRQVIVRGGEPDQKSDDSPS